MNNNLNDLQSSASRRSFFGKGLALAGTAAASSTLLAQNFVDAGNDEEDSGRLNKGDAAILRFLAAAELIESDLWVQYNELGGVQDTSERPELGGGGSPIYASALANLDSDMSQYIYDNTDDELSHAEFLNAYLASKGEETVVLTRFEQLPSSKATGALQKGRLTNLMQLTVDTSWYTKYRGSRHNPDLDPTFVFPPAVPGLAKGQHPAIPRTDDDLTPQDHIQAIANTAGFHFAFIEQGGTSLYPSLAQRVNSRQVLRILLSIGPTETCHFQTWHDKAGNGVNGSILPSPLVDPKDHTLVFPNLNIPAGRERFQTNLIMPEPCPFLRKLPVCSVIRPTKMRGAARRALAALTADGLFIGQSPEFFAFLRDLADDADEARRENEG